MNFYEKLQSFNSKIARSFSSHSVAIVPCGVISYNAPFVKSILWFTGPLSLWTLKEMEKSYMGFCAMEGGSLQGIALQPRTQGGVGLVVTILYVSP